MAQVTAALVKQLREMTNSPMMECKKALVKADGDIDRAVDILREMGVAKAVKRAGRATNEGTIGTYVSEDGHTAAILELSCETDFVGTNPKFTGFAADLAKVVAENNPTDLEALKACKMGQGTVDSELTEMIHIIGENMKIMRFTRVEQPEGGIAGYIHLGGKLASLVSFSFGKAETNANETFKTFAHDVAMQVVAADPVSATIEDVPADVLEHEKAIYAVQAAESGKPEFVQQKMVEGRVNKFYKESVLSEQVFIKDNDTTISELAKKVSKEAGDDIKIVSFVRFSFGEAE